MENSLLKAIYTALNMQLMKNVDEFSKENSTHLIRILFEFS